MIDVAAFPHLRRASEVQLELVARLRRGERLPLSGDHDGAEAQRLFNIEVQEVRRWASRARLGTVQRHSAEVASWSPIVRERYGVDAVYERCHR